ncbi:uncharacterized protein HaLaN_06879 [Haematococcus lacustris]|uniref:Uncharacterized protein n=1 Tax=Haematococcus lacustris TaxID=44745 RepID=A0A699YN01_HAELA|nr:uncharacterized protein HaLaN_06879 [Haematococcus lacustris]
MASVKSKIRKLLADLDLSESGGIEAAVVAASSNSFDEFLLPSKAWQRTADSIDDVDDGCSDVTDTDKDSNIVPPWKPEKQLHLERRALQLMADNKTLEQAARRKDMEIAELQAHLNSVVRDFEAWQREVEARAPLLNTRLQEVRDSLTDLRISDAKYAELKSMDPTALGLLDCVKVAAHEATRELAAENERLRLSMASTREAAARSEEEGARLRAEAARLSTSIVEKEREQQRTTEGLQGQMYDELRARTERLQEDNQRLQVIEASFKRLEQQHQELRLVAQQREHGHEMLVTDKAYLSKQAEFLAAAQSRLQNEVEARDAKIAELQRQKQELFDKLVQTESLKNREGDARLQRELAALQAATHADMERIRAPQGPQPVTRPGEAVAVGHPAEPVCQGGQAQAHPVLPWAAGLLPVGLPPPPACQRPAPAPGSGTRVG